MRPIRFRLLATALFVLSCATGAQPVLGQTQIQQKKPEAAAPSAVTPSAPAPLDRATLEKKIDELVNAHMAVNGFSGSVLLAHEGKPLVAKGYGFANVEWQIPNTTNTKFRIGSITKQFTSMIVMQLREQGKIKLEDSIC